MDFKEMLILHSAMGMKYNFEQLAPLLFNYILPGKYHIIYSTRAYITSSFSQPCFRGTRFLFHQGQDIQKGLSRDCGAHLSTGLGENSGSGRPGNSMFLAVNSLAASWGVRGQITRRRGGARTALRVWLWGLNRETHAPGTAPGPQEPRLRQLHPPAALTEGSPPLPALEQRGDGLRRLFCRLFCRRRFPAAPAAGAAPLPRMPRSWVPRRRPQRPDLQVGQVVAARPRTRRGGI